VAYGRVGDVLNAQGNLEEALKDYREGLAVAKKLTEMDPENSQWQQDVHYGIDGIGGLAFRFVLTGDFTVALEAADQAISLAPDELWLYTNRAHALMLLGHVDEARALYLKYRDEKDVQSGKSWKTVVLEDFGELRKSGKANALMEEIQGLFASSGGHP